MKICFVNTLYHPCALGGTQSVVREQAERLVAEGHQVTVIATSETDALQRYTLAGVQVIKLPLANVYNPYGSGAFMVHPRHHRLFWHLRDRFNPAMERQLLEVPEFRAADVISANGSSGFSVSCWRAAHRAGVPLVVVLHDYYALCGRTAMYRTAPRQTCETQCRKCRIMRNPARRLSSRATAVVGVSHFTLQKHLDQGYFTGVPAHAIHNGIAPLPLPDTPRNGPVRRLAFLGAIIPEKGVDVLIEAFNQIDDPEIDLHIFGKGPDDYVEALKASDQSGRIQWRGVLPAAEALGQVDALVVPSLWDEPFGRVVVEALSARCAVLGARRGGIPEILEGCAAGRAFEPLQPDTLSAEIRALCALPAEAVAPLRDAARARASAFTEEQSYRKHLQVLQAAASEGRS